MFKKCFLICPIGEDGSEIRRVSDIVLKYIVSPVCKEFGYDVIRSDTEFTINSINDDIFNHLDNDELAIADLTGLNPNVFYEAGYRKAKDLPLIHIAREGTALPFDIKTIRTYFYDIDVDKTDSAKEALRKVIGNISTKSSTFIQKLLTNSKPQDNGLTRDTKNFFKAIYQEYVKRRKNGILRSEAIQFGNSQILSEMLNIPFDDVECCSRELHKFGLLKCDWADNMVFFSYLTEKGIKYGEDNFDEPTYIILLREIIKQYNLRRAYVPSDRFKDFSSDDFSVLKSEGFIDVTTYLNGDFVVKPTDNGIKEIALRDR